MQQCNDTAKMDINSREFKTS